MTDRLRLPALALALAGLAWPVALEAQAVPRYPGAPTQPARVGYDDGYREGLRAGQDDARTRRGYDYQRHSAWRNTNRGYGDARYRDSFRDGFAAGYRQGYQRYGYPTANRPPYYPGNSGYPGYPGYPGSYGRYGGPAWDNGYRDGYDQGLRDAQRNRRFDPIGDRKYRKGDAGYNKRYGAKDDYKRFYRDAFSRGYQEGFRSYRVGGGPWRW